MADVVPLRQPERAQRTSWRHGIPRLHVVTPPVIDAAVGAVTALVLGAGAPLVQARSKSPIDRQRLAEARGVFALARNQGAVCVINDRVDIALALGADGVHVGDDDVPAAVARTLLGPEAIIGVTCRDAESARRAADDGASYVGVGPVYATSTKSGLPRPLGPGGIEAVARAVTIPVIAIAGVTAAAVPELLGAGAWGVAVVGAVYGSPDPAAAVAELVGVLG